MSTRGRAIPRITRRDFLKLGVGAAAAGTSLAFPTLLAGLAGGLIAPISAVTPFPGVDYALPAFFVIVIGGVGSWAGMLLGAATIGAATFGLALPTSYVIAQVLTLLLAIVFVRIRPQGLVPTLTG